ncbi:MAG TPA: hypothetical protein VLZ54_07420 [Arenibacter sp.]|nr:hypothetical protein [Arenibacter sp.]
MAYFKLGEVQLITDDIQAEQQILARTNGASMVNTSQKLIYLDRLNEMTIRKYLISNKEIGNDTMVYIPNIYKSRDRQVAWRKIKELEKVTVSVDMFYGGLIFFRREQAKEHFKIRI